MWTKAIMAWVVVLALAFGGGPVAAKDTVKVAFISPLTGGVSAIGVGGRNSADLAVRLKNADSAAKYKYELLVLDDECKPNIGVQVATKAAEIFTGAASLGGPVFMDEEEVIRIASRADELYRQRQLGLI